MVDKKSVSTAFQTSQHVGGQANHPACAYSLSAACEAGSIALRAGTNCSAPACMAVMLGTD